MAGVNTLNIEGFELLAPCYGMHSDQTPFMFREVISQPDTVVVMKYQWRLNEEWEI